MTKVAIIGAGLSGLSTAHLLKDYAKVFLFEKARGVSGRMSTRRAETYFFDHGAQYFTARTQPFKDFLLPLLNSGVIKRWNPRYVIYDDIEIIEQKNWANDEPRYVGVPGMNAVTQSLADSLNVSINTKISSIQRKNKWELKDETGRCYDGFDWIISTVPAPQVLNLMPKSFIHHDKISAIKMLASFTLMLGFKEELTLDFEAAHVTNCDLSWIAVNSSKPGRENGFALTVHSSADYAETHINDEREEIMQHLISETSRIIGKDVSKANFKTIHGWRYANNDVRNKSFVFLDLNNKLAACGDWCFGGRVEGAFTSAYTLVKAMRESVF